MFGYVLFDFNTGRAASNTNRVLARSTGKARLLYAFSSLFYCRYIGSAYMQCNNARVLFPSSTLHLSRASRTKLTPHQETCFGRCNMVILTKSKHVSSLVLSIKPRIRSEKNNLNVGYLETVWMGKDSFYLASLRTWKVTLKSARKHHTSIFKCQWKRTINLE